MTRILHTGDLHLGSFPGPERDGRNVRFETMCRLLDDVVEAAASRGADFAILAGDLWHQAKVWSDRGLREQAVMVDFVTRLAGVCPVLVMRGTPNHDSAEQFRALERSLGRVGTDYAVWVVTGHGCGVYPDRNGNFLNVACLPGYDREVYADVVEKYAGAYPVESAAATVAINELVGEMRTRCVSGFPSVLVGHFTMQGCDMESGQTAFFSETEPVVDPRAVNTARYDLVCFNHIHKRQAIKNCERAFYSGAISQLNFNDEGQERGIYFHDLNDDGTLTSEFVRLDGTEFLTVWLNDAQVRAVIEDDDVLALRAPEIRDKIVRVRYNCTEDTNKSFRHADAERRLYDAGAVYVSEISPVSVASTVGGLAMNVDASPEAALTDYLLNAGRDAAETQALVDLARPIISIVDASASTERRTGLFMPVEIAVKNYRNYVEQEFDFRNVRFCTINGENGVGKSSLFMDAVVDCLFEEPREGDLTGWIRNDLKAKSGKIRFVFTLGDEKFRVERTRAKSGKMTLSLAVEGDDGTWRDMSCSKSRDTQQRIVDLIGMDCRTFKSCALIMQDQYGLFLCADKAERMGILGSILGLGFYDDLEAAADRARAEESREIRIIESSIDKSKSKLPDVDVLDNNIRTCEGRVAEMDAALAASRAEAETVRAALADARTAADRVAGLDETLEKRLSRLDAASVEVAALTSEAAELEKTLDREAEIRAGVEALERATVLRDERGRDAARVDVLLNQVERAREGVRREFDERERLACVWDAARERAAGLRAEMDAVDVADVEARLERLLAVNDEYNDLVDNQRPKNVAAERAVRAAERGVAEYEAGFAAELGALDAEIRGLDEQAALLDSETGCVDAARAECVFLRAARKARERASELRAEREGRVSAHDEEIARLAAEVDALRANFDETMEDRVAAKKAEYDALFPVTREHEALDKLRTSVRAADAALEDARSRLADEDVRVERARDDLASLEAGASGADAVRAGYEASVAEVEALAHWAEDERALELARVRLEAVREAVARLDREVEMLDREVESLTAERADFVAKSAELGDLAARLDVLVRVVETTQEGRDRQAEALGGLRRERRAVQDDLDEIDELTATLRAREVRAVRYSVLREAFSQDGIRHRIVKSVIPGLESTASAILGQMSGGRMSVELVTEKTLKSNSKREVGTLDVIIHDDATGRLPYMSRSGGERVKAALSVILALAEMKGSQAGIQLGFLGIDEPPFLDARGAQAYCDALEAIQRRYSDMKIVAISHDESMKARFPQNVTVVKTSNGSRLETVV